MLFLFSLYLCTTYCSLSLRINFKRAIFHPKMCGGQFFESRVFLEANFPTRPIFEEDNSPLLNGGYSVQKFAS